MEIPCLGSSVWRDGGPLIRPDNGVLSASCQSKLDLIMGWVQTSYLDWVERWVAFGWEESRKQVSIPLGCFGLGSTEKRVQMGSRPWATQQQRMARWWPINSATVSDPALVFHRRSRPVLMSCVLRSLALWFFISCGGAACFSWLVLVYLNLNYVISILFFLLDHQHSSSSL
jgi:hypothetical protein